jgi:hypothetical protein
LTIVAACSRVLVRHSAVGVAHVILLLAYFAATSSWFEILVTPWTCLAFDSIEAFSAALATGPRRVTAPPP